MKHILLSGTVIWEALQADRGCDFDALWEVLQSPNVQGYITQTDLDGLYSCIAKEQGVSLAFAMVNRFKKVLKIYQPESKRRMVDAQVSRLFGRASSGGTATAEAVAVEAPLLTIDGFLERHSLELLYKGSLANEESSSLFMQWYRKWRKSGFDPMMLFPIIFALTLQQMPAFRKWMMELSQDADDPNVPPNLKVPVRSRTEEEIISDASEETGDRPHRFTLDNSPRSSQRHANGQTADQAGNPAQSGNQQGAQQDSSQSSSSAQPIASTSESSTAAVTASKPGSAAAGARTGQSAVRSGDGGEFDVKSGVAVAPASELSSSSASSGRSVRSRSSSVTESSAASLSATQQEQGGQARQASSQERVDALWQSVTAIAPQTSRGSAARGLSAFDLTPGRGSIFSTPSNTTPIDIGRIDPPNNSPNSPAPSNPNITNPTVTNPTIASPTIANPAAPTPSVTAPILIGSAPTAFANGGNRISNNFGSQTFSFAGTASGQSGAEAPGTMGIATSVNGSGRDVFGLLSLPKGFAWSFNSSSDLLQTAGGFIGANSWFNPTSSYSILNGSPAWTLPNWNLQTSPNPFISQPTSQSSFPVSIPAQVSGGVSQMLGQSVSRLGETVRSDRSDDLLLGGDRRSSSPQRNRTVDLSPQSSGSSSAPSDSLTGSATNSGQMVTPVASERSGRRSVTNLGFSSSLGRSIGEQWLGSVAQSPSWLGNAFNFNTGLGVTNGNPLTIA
jgi:hypothetical protein